MSEQTIPEGYKLVDDSNGWIIEDLEKGTYHLFVDGKVSGFILDPDHIRWLIKSKDADDRVFKALRRYLRYLNKGFNVENDIDNFLNLVTGKSLNKKKFDELVDEGYARSKARDLSEYKDYELTEDGMIIAYIRNVELVNTMWIIDEKEGIVKAKNAFDVKLNIDKWSGEITGEVSYPEDYSEYRFKPEQTGELIGLDWFVGHNKKKDSYAYTIHPAAVALDGFNYLKVLIDPANIISMDFSYEMSTLSMVVFKFQTLEYKNNDVHLKIEDEKLADYIERCDEEWEEYKAETIKQAKEDLEEIIDFDVN